MPSEKFEDIGRVAAIGRLFEGSGFTRRPHPVYPAGDGLCLVSASRLLLEGIDFNLVYFPLKHLGYKAVVEVTGDLFASLAAPRNLLVRLGVSAKLDFDSVSQLWEGMLAAAREFSYENIDLDLQPSRNGLAISVSADGFCTEPAAGGPGARSKDLLCISGNLGGAFFGLQVLERASRDFDAGKGQPDLDKYRMMVASYLKPELAPGIPEQFAKAGVTPVCARLVDRGLADAVRSIAAQTGLGAKVYADKIPFEGGCFDLGKELGLDPVSAAMNGGEDFRLLYVIPILEMEKFRASFPTFDIVGHLALPEAGTVLVSPEGLEFPLKSQGWAD